MKKFKKIYIEITNICNLNCSFCSKNNREKREISLDEFELILKRIDSYTDYLYLHVKGEPLLHSKFADILNLCKKYNKQVNITTNATLLYKQYEAILNSSVRQVNISLHSITDKSKLTEIIKFADILSKKINVQYRIWVDNNDWIIKQLENHYKIKIVGNVKINSHLYFNRDKEFVWPKLSNDYITDNGTCYGLRTHIAILSDGTVIPCCLDADGIINLGNILTESLSDILNKNRTKSIKEGFQNNKLCEELCQKCGFRERRIGND